MPGIQDKNSKPPKLFSIAKSDNDLSVTELPAIIISSLSNDMLLKLFANLITTDDRYSEVARAAEKAGIGHLVLRCEVDPDFHPKIQKRLNKALKGIDGTRGFVIDVPVSSRDGRWHVNYVTCSEN